jgi:hypothetical protein
MDIVRITLTGQGYDVVRGIVSKKEYEKLKTLDNIWIKNLNKKLKKKLKGFIVQFHDYGISKGEVIISVNNEEVFNLPINILDGYNFNTVNLVDVEGYAYPIITNDVVMTSVQNLEGVFMDVMFVVEDFDINKLKFIKKEIQDENENNIIDSLISEVYYDGENIIFTGNNTDLRMVKFYYDTGEEKVLKNEKGKNR